MAEKQTDEGVKSFAAFVRDVCDGDTESEASIELWGLFDKLRQVQEKNGGVRKGKIALVLAFAWDGKTMTIDHDINVKAPKQPRQQGQVWLTKANNYTFKNPRQQELQFPRDVSIGRPAVADDAGEPARIAEGT
jgi:hypothetical protein